MNPNFKWLLIGAGALVLLLVLLTCLRPVKP